MYFFYIAVIFSFYFIILIYNFSTCIIYVTDIVTQVVTATPASLEPRVRRVVLLTNTRVLVLRGSLDKIVMKSRVKIDF